MSMEATSLATSILLMMMKVHNEHPSIELLHRSPKYRLYYIKMLQDHFFVRAGASVERGYLKNTTSIPAPDEYLELLDVRLDEALFRAFSRNDRSEYLKDASQGL